MIPEEVLHEARMLIEEEVERRLGPFRLKIRALEARLRELRARVVALEQERARDPESGQD